MRNRSISFYVLLGFVTGILFVSCGKGGVSTVNIAENPQDAQSLISEDVNSVLDSNDSPEQKAARLVLIGEEVLQNQKGFALAKAVFDEAYAESKKSGGAGNKDAEFFTIVLDLPMALRGIFGDLKAIGTQKISKEIDEGLKKFDKDEKYVKEFLDSGNVPTKLKIKGSDTPITIAEIQSINGMTFQKISKFQNLLEHNLMAKFIYVMDRLDAFYDRYPNFRKRIILPIHFRDEDGKPLKQKVGILFDRAMALALKSALLGAVSFIKLAISYDLNDLNDIERKILEIEKDGNRAPQAILDVLYSYSQFLILRRNDFLAEASLEPDKTKRPVMNDLKDLFDDGGTLDQLHDALLDQNRDLMGCSRFVVCIPPMAPEDLETFRAAIFLGKEMISGPTVIEVDDIFNSEGLTTLRVDFTTFLTNQNNKFYDLKVFLPTFDATQDQPFIFQDATFGGLFPDGDFEDKLLKIDFEPPPEEELR